MKARFGRIFAGKAICERLQCFRPNRAERGRARRGRGRDVSDGGIRQVASSLTAGQYMVSANYTPSAEADKG